MDFQGLKVGDFLLNRECKRTRARVPVNAGYDVKPGTDQNKIHMIYHPRPQAQARAALTVALGQAVDLRRNSDAEAWSHSICISP